MDEELRLMLVAMRQRIERLEGEVARLKRAEPHIEPAPVLPPAAMAPPPPQPVSKPAAAARNVSIESAIGTKWIGRIGMIAIIFGIGFLLKYSFDNQLIGVTGRVILGIMTGVLFLAGGEYFSRRDNWRLYSQILTGGGIAILYLSIYAAYAFYALIEQLPAFAALIAITTTGITLSVRYSAVVIAVIGMLGGFLTPLMLSTGENRPIELFSYILLLDIGILAVGYFRRWQLLSGLSLLLTIVMYSAWHIRFFTPEQQLTAFCITTAFFILYNLFSVICIEEEGKKGELLVPGIIALSAFWYLVSFFDQNHNVYDWQLKSFVLGLSAIEISLGSIVLARAPGRQATIYSYAGISIIISVIALFVIFERQWQAAALAAEMVIICFIGLKLRRAYVRVFSYLLGLIVLALFFREAQLHLAPFEHYLPVLNYRFLACMVMIAAFYAMLWQLWRSREALDTNEMFAVNGIAVATQVLTVYLLSIEAIDYFGHAQDAISLIPVESRYAKQLTLSVIWALYASIIIGIGIAKKLKLLRLLGIALIGITILKLFLVDLAELRTIYRIISFVVLGFILLAVSYFYNRFKQRIFGEGSQQ